MINDFFQPLSNAFSSLHFPKGSIGEAIKNPTDDFSEEVALFSVGNEWLSIRQAFYSLMNHFPSIKVVDYGVFSDAKNKKNALAGLVQVLEWCYDNQIKVMILGEGTTEVTSQWAAHLSDTHPKDVCFVTPSFNTPILEPFWDIWSTTKGAKSLFHVSLCAHQSYFNPPEIFEKINSFFYDEVRLGELRNQPTVVETLLRESDFLAFDVNAIKANECNAGTMQNPNGLNSEEACLISRYAGIANSLRSFGIYGLQKSIDNKDSMQIAQMMWYFLDGLDTKFYDFPDENNRDFHLLRCPLDGMILSEMLFLKSLKSGRVWMQVNYNTAKRWIGCLEEDYLLAVQGEIPEKWFRSGGIDF